MKDLHRLANKDLNLLSIFEAMFRTNSVTQAAKLLGLSQPAMSHALARLRQTLGDPLFVKTASGMAPTPRALELAPAVQSVVCDIENKIFSPQEFLPNKISRLFRIKTTDYVEAMLLPYLLKLLQKEEAEGVQVSSTNTCYSLPREELEQGHCDIAVAGFFGSLPDGFYQQKLFEDELVCAVRASHPFFNKKKSLSLQDFCALPHALIAPGGDLNSNLDTILKQSKMRREVKVGCSSFLGAGWIVSETDTVLTGPKRLVEMLQSRFPLKVFPVPVQLPAITIVQVWHERNNADSAHKWFRGLVKQSFQL